MKSPRGLADLPFAAGLQAFDGAPDNGLFVVRDLGNQIATAAGSVDYGVLDLHTPLLLIIGHPDCAAVRMAAEDYSQQPPAIRNALDNLEIPRGESGIDGVELNVNRQVRYALNKYEAEVVGGKLTVVGAVYDFDDELGHGRGKLDIINVNGETDPASIAALNLMKGLDKPLRRRVSGRRRK